VVKGIGSSRSVVFPKRWRFRVDDRKARQTSGQNLPSGEPSGQWARPAGLALLLFFVTSCVAMMLFNDPASIGRAEQPISFNHLKHVEELGLECDSCHEFYREETFSGLPEAETCEFCHAEAQGETAEEARLVQLLEEGKPLEWQSLFRQPSHVFFTHRRHVVMAEVECDVCHGDIGSTERPPEWVHLMTMDDCVECHEREQAGVRCNTCHR
jgi:hypothetical protein